MQLYVVAVTILSAIILASVVANPMFYKRNENDKYEPDWIAVSSTVIPITEYELTARLGDPISEEYKKAYFKHLKKKKATLMDPDKLITVKKTFYGKKESQ